MGAHPDAARRDLAQQRVEIAAVAAVVNRVDLHEHAMERGESCAHGVENIVLVDHWFCIDTDTGESREDGPEPAGLGRGAAARRFIAPPQDPDAAEASCRLRQGSTSATFALKADRAMATFVKVGVSQAPGIPKTAGRPSPVHRSHREGSGLVA